MNRKLSNKVAFGILIPFLSIIALLIVNKTAVQDWLHFRGYEASAQIELLAEAADMSPEGERLFYRADPELTSQARVEKLCLGADNLGCLVTGPKIYILESKSGDKATRAQATVTGAHEMLHMVYLRLGEEDKADVNRMIDAALPKINDTRIFSILDNTQTDVEYYDEAHALLGTEVKRLPLELEAHYRQYFNERDSILKAYDDSKSLL